MFDTRDGQYKYRFDVHAIGGSGIVEYANSMVEMLQTMRAYGCANIDTMEVSTVSGILFTVGK
jgi:hypothetical protein